MAAALGGSAAGAATSIKPATAGSAGVVRTVHRGTALPAPVGKPLGKPAGLQAPELRRDPGGAEAGSVLRSHSPRPSANSIRAAAAAAGLTIPIVASTPVGGSAGLHQSWRGLNGFDQRYANGGNQFSVEPPDQALCVGNGFALEAVNTVLQVFRTSGAPATGVVDLNTFYGYPAQFNRTTGDQGPFLTDPICIYDHGTNRFYLVVLTLDQTTAGQLLGTNHLDLAVSQTSDPTGSWNIYRLPVQDDGTQGTPVHTDCPCIGDYPHIGSDANAVFVTTNEYPFSSAPGKYGNNFNGAQIYAFDKRALAAGVFSVNVVQFQDTSVANGTSSRTPGFTVWPAQVPGTAYATANGGTEYLLSSVAGEEAQPAGFTGIADKIAQYAVTNTSSIRTVPNLHLQGALLASETYGVPPRSSQKVGPVPLRDCLAVNCFGINDPNGPDPNEAEGPLDSNDSRMQQVYYSGGMIYGALDSAMQVQNNLQAGVAWFAVAPGTAPYTSTVARQGYVGVARNNVNYPALAVLPSGAGTMAVTLVGANYYPTSAYIPFGGAGTGAVQIAAAGAAPQDGFSEYNAFGSPPRPRWGDYSAAVTSGSSIFIATEYIANKCTFAQFSVDFTCGGTRGFLINWATRLSRVTP